MKQIFIILFLSAVFISCKNEKKKNEVIFNFGLENKVIVNNKLRIPEFNIVKSSLAKNEMRYATVDYYTSPCYIDSGKIKIISSLNPMYNFRICLNEDLTFQVKYNDVFKNNGKTLLKKEIKESKITKQRLLINKYKYIIGDTIKGTYYFQIYLTHLNDSFSILNDSFSFAYIIQKKNISLESIFSTDFYCIIGYNYPTKIPIDLSYNNIIQTDSELNLFTFSDSIERQTKSKEPSVISCDKKQDSILILLNTKNDEQSKLKLSLKNRNYLIEYINPKPLLDGNTYDYYISSSNLFFNKKVFLKGDTIHCRGYYLLSTLSSMNGFFYNQIDSLSFSTIVK